MTNKLKELRDTRSQAEVALALGITKSHYAYIEAGERTPSLPVALRIADYFGKSLEEIFGSLPTQPPTT